MRSAWRMFIFAMFSVSVAATKTLHLYVNAHAIPPASVVLLPAFVLPDLFVLCIAHIMLRRGRWMAYWLRLSIALPVMSVDPVVMRVISRTYRTGSMVTFGAATAELTFYWATGGELKWADTAAFAFHDESRRVLLSGFPVAASVASVIILLSLAVQRTSYKSMRDFVAFTALQWSSIMMWAREKFTRTDKHNTNPTVPWSYISEKRAASNSVLPVSIRMETSTVGATKWTGSPFALRPSCTGVSRLFLGIASVALVELALITVLRPSGPYIRLLETLPVSLIQAFRDDEGQYCSSGPWPPYSGPAKSLETLPKYAKASRGKQDWAIRKHRGKTPAWLSAPLPPGFYRWDREMQQSNGSFAGLFPSPRATQTPGTEGPRQSRPNCAYSELEQAFYDSINDPLKISNLENDILKPLQLAMAEGSVSIRHIVLIQMESMRQELFPLQYGSDFHRLITATHDSPDLDHLNVRLASLTPNSEILTGKNGGFVSSNDHQIRSSSRWNDTTAPSLGGLTIVGAHTTSSVSFKSTAAIHCGLWPMPVDMFEEADLTNYQPCLPQILELFNRLKEPESGADWRNFRWNRAFFQSITDEYDRQAKFNAKIGFTHVVNKLNIKDTFRDQESLEEINYFGYAETVLKPYIKDFIINATKSEQRMFLSHFTSTTHHPWGTPSGFDTVAYMGRSQGLTHSHQDMNKYLNAVRWHDAWLGELMQLFDDLGIAEETLVVLVGDHGQAFKEDCSKSGTYENSHISNFRIPMVFRHPKLPRLELNIQTTSISILPTILDLLISTGSLNEKDTSAAVDLIGEYEGQSLIRSYKSESGGRRAWNFGVVNPGGRMLVVTSADTPWRLALPLVSEGEYIFTNLDEDPLETRPLKHWSLERLFSDIGSGFGKSVAEWAAEAHTVALWWVEERRRLWTAVPDVAT
ncbi:hypothetical protein PCL_08352 [Purpureocillium lilacinum]|uniref:Sulfatase N-terminal domain-containing protein n=1 Tax=Purpureocillium lilacinum TaxID=33203 RepID=A0A2U3DRW2_PURLI|nr:hypothetical protein PCL_08352 [Purpureocillium lilacinum]